MSAVDPQALETALHRDGIEMRGTDPLIRQAAQEWLEEKGHTMTAETRYIVLCVHDKLEAHSFSNPEERARSDGQFGWCPGGEKNVKKSRILEVPNDE